MSRGSPALPDISRFATISRAKWATFGDRLRDAGLTDDFVASISPRVLRTRDSEPLISWRLRRSPNPAAVLYRMFSMRDPVPEIDAAEALGGALLADFLDAGLLVTCEPGCIVSDFDLQVVNGLQILCDDLIHGGDAVFGSGPGTSALCRSVSTHCRLNDTLDFGCGAGTAALWAARYSNRVLATDINPRALRFVEINCALNGITNVQTRVSDLFEDLSGLSFDLIMAQLPFVPDPGVDSSATYRFGGRRGNELALRAIAETPQHLRPGGRGVVVFLQPIDSRPAGPQNDLEERRAKDMSALLLLGPETDADGFSVRYAESELGLGTGQFHTAVVQMREHLNSSGVSGLCPAICVLQHRPGAQGWTRRFGASGDLWRDVTATAINRLLASETLLHQPASLLLRARLRIPKGAVIIEPFDSGTEQKLFLAGAGECLSKPLELTRAELTLLQSVNRAPDVESSLIAFDPREREAALVTISRGLRAGLFDVVAGEGQA